MKFDMDTFLKDRREALLSLDVAKMQRYLAKYGSPMNLEDADPEVQIASIHKARTACKDLPIEERRMSKKWLLDHGYSSMDDGDVDPDHGSH